MTDVALWIEEKIASHRVGTDNSPAALQHLVSACAALAGRGGTAFGLAPPAGGYPDAERLYRLSCDALGEWMKSIEDSDLRTQLTDVIRRHDLAVDLPEGVAWEPQRPESDMLLRVVKRLETAGCRILRAEDAPIPTHDELEALISSVAPRTIPGALREWITQAPSRIALEWVHEPTDLQGFVHYDIAKVPDLYRDCAQQVDEWLRGLEHYYTVWSKASPFIETDNGQGFIAVGEQGEVLHLDNEGNTDLNGLHLGKNVDEFWHVWQSLAFVAFDLDVLEKIREEGFGVGTSLGQSVATVLGPEGINGR